MQRLQDEGKNKSVAQLFIDHNDALRFQSFFNVNRVQAVANVHSEMFFLFFFSVIDFAIDCSDTYENSVNNLHSQRMKVVCMHSQLIVSLQTTMQILFQRLKCCSVIFDRILCNFIMHCLFSEFSSRIIIKLMIDDVNMKKR